MKTETLLYYEKKAEEFSEQTIDVDFSNVQNKFMSKLSDGAYILDFGCGSGRDTKCFLENGFQVEAIDGSEELCRIATENTGIKVKNMLFQDLNECEKYDAIWACASILHLPYDELVDVMNKMVASLKEQGFIYASFKYGEYEGLKNERYFINLTEKSAESILQKVDNLIIEEMWVSSDARPGRGEEKWLNLFLRKRNTQ